MRKSIFFLLLTTMLAISCKAQVKVLGKIVPNSIIDQYPTHIDSLGQGGLMVFKTWQERNSIPTPRRKAGMIVRVKSAAVDSSYTLGVGLSNAAWSIYTPVNISGKANLAGSNTFTGGNTFKGDVTVQDDGRLTVKNSYEEAIRVEHSESGPQVSTIGMDRIGNYNDNSGEGAFLIGNSVLINKVYDSEVGPASFSLRPNSQAPLNGSIEVNVGLPRESGTMALFEQLLALTKVQVQTHNSNVGGDFIIEESLSRLKKLYLFINPQAGLVPVFLPANNTVGDIVEVHALHAAFSDSVVTFKDAGGTPISTVDYAGYPGSHVVGFEWNGSAWIMKSPEGI